MGNSFRNQPGPTLYPENKTPVTEDVLEVGLLFAASIIAFSFILIIPGIRGTERLWATVRVFTAMFIGCVILVSNFGYCWYCGSICTRTQYKAYISPAGSRQEIEARIGLYIGLRGTNITLREQNCGFEDDYMNEKPFPNEEIDYNEQILWADPWGQGRLGFGRYAGRYNREFRALQFRGAPYPILWIAEYFTLDGELIRWGRKFRTAGWYTHILLWTSFATYLIAILLFIFNIQQGAKFTVITGCLMILSVFAYGVIIINDPPLELPFQDAALNRSTSIATTSNATTSNATTSKATLPSTVLNQSTSSATLPSPVATSNATLRSPVPTSNATFPSTVPTSNATLRSPVPTSDATPPSPVLTSSATLPSTVPTSSATPLPLPSPVPTSSATPLPLPSPVPTSSATLPSTVLKPSFGWSWWLTLWTGVGTFFLGIFILVLDKFWPSTAAAIFHHSIIEDDLSFFEEDSEEPTPEEYRTAPRIQRGQGGTTRGRTRRGLKPHDTVRPWPEIKAPSEEVIELQEVPTAKEEQAPQ